MRKVKIDWSAMYMNLHDGALAKVKEILRQTSVETAINWLRTERYTKLESIEMLRKVLEISYEEAFYLVRNSQTWSDVKAFDDKLMNDFFDILEEWQD